MIDAHADAVVTLFLAKDPSMRRISKRMILPLSSDPFVVPTDRDMLPSERRKFVLTHRTCIFGHARKADGPSMSIVYYVPTDGDELLVSTMRGRAKAKAVARSGKVSLCILDERWPFAYLQVYCDATVETDPELVVDVMMAVGGRMSGTPLPSEARPVVADDGGGRGQGRAPVPAVRDLRAAAASSAPQRPRREDHALGVAHAALGRARRSFHEPGESVRLAAARAGRSRRRRSRACCKPSCGSLHVGERAEIGGRVAPA